MQSLILVEETEGITTAALIEDGRLTETISGSEDKAQLSGNIYLGRVQNAEKGLNAVFVDIGLERTAIMSGSDLPRNADGKRYLPSGGEILVQVTKLPLGEKGASVSSRIKLAGRYMVLMPNEKGVSISRRIEDAAESERLRRFAEKIRQPGMGLILRTNAQGAKEEELKAEVERLYTEWQEIQKRAEHLNAPAIMHDESDICYRTARDLLNGDIGEVIVSKQALSERMRECMSILAPDCKTNIRLLNPSCGLLNMYRIPAQIKEALGRRIWLKSGAFIVFDRTEALTAIDVNSGKYTGREDADEMIRFVNREAAEEIMRQLRLRDIGGIIIVDFIDMKTQKDREDLLEAMREYAKTDRGRTQVIDITTLGLMELTRKRKNEELKTYFGGENP